MATQTVTLMGKRYVLLSEAEYRRITSPNRKNKRTTPRKRISSDTAEAIHRLADKSERRVSWATVKREAGLE